MSGDDQVSASHQGAVGLEPTEGDTEPSMLLQKLKNNISKQVQSKVDLILQEVQRFSDNDKLYLYLQLPSGPSSGDKSGGDCGSLNTSDQLHTCNWIRSHLEEHSDTCLPKQDVYETYKRHCENLQHRPLSAANFGKIIRDIFPNIKARRLGGRGQSKYCYSGIRRKTVLNMPLLPNLDLKNDPAELTELVQTYRQEVTEAACELICDWAQKILKRSFDTVVEIARYLIQEHIVNPRCSQAELVCSAALAGGPAKPYKVIKKTPVSKPEADGALDQKKEAGDSCVTSSLKSGDRVKAAVEAQPSPSSLPPALERRLQVEAFMKKLPTILPRSSIPDKLSVRSSPPSLAPKDGSGSVGGASAAAANTASATSAGSGGAVKVIAMATLPQQQGAPVPVMILPQSCLSYDRTEKIAAPPTNTTSSSQQVCPSSASTSSSQTSVVQKTKRRLENTPPITLNVPPHVKRKRGRPRKPRPEETQAVSTVPQLPSAIPPQAPPPIITSVTGGVIQKATSANTGAAATSSNVVELVIQDQALVFSPLAPESRGSVMLSAPLAMDTDKHQPSPRPVLLLQNPNWELAPSSQMVEVIQKAPRPSNTTNNNNMVTTTLATPLNQVSSISAAPAEVLPLTTAATVHPERGEVEITLTPVEVSLPSSSSVSVVVKKDEEESERKRDGR